MGLFHHESDEAKAYGEVDGAQTKEHKAKLSHELIAGAAAYEAAKKYQEHCESKGKPSSHAKAKEILAGLAGVAVDRLIETKGLDLIDKHKAKKQAEAALGDASASHYDD